MPRSTPTLLLMALLLPLSPARAETTETCAPVERVERQAPVYVLIYGYRHATDQPLPALDMVAHDVRHMDRFYAALGPARTWVHAEREPQLVIPFGESLRPPTWQSLSTSVAEMISALDAHHGDARPQVYLYFVGHGDQPGGGVMDRGELYARPDPERSGPGHDGIIDARLPPTACCARSPTGPTCTSSPTPAAASTCSRPAAESASTGAPSRASPRTSSSRRSPADCPTSGRCSPPMAARR